MPRGSVICEVNQDGDTLIWEYDTYQRPTRFTDATGRVLTYAYTADNRLRSLDNGLDTQLDKQDTSLHYDYNAEGQLMGISQGRWDTRYAYDPQGRFYAQGNGLQQIKQLQYYQDNGPLGRIVREDGSVIRYDYQQHDDQQSDYPQQTDNPSGHRNHRRRCQPVCA